MIIETVPLGLTNVDVELKLDVGNLNCCVEGFYSIYYPSSNTFGVSFWTGVESAANVWLLVVVGAAEAILWFSVVLDDNVLVAFFATKTVKSAFTIVVLSDVMVTKGVVEF